MEDQGQNQAVKKTGPAGKIVLVVVGLVVTAMGAAFCWLLWTSYERAMLTRGWDEVPALVVKAEVIEERVTRNSPLAFRPEVLYRYEYGGKNFEGKSLRMVDGRSNDRGKAEKKIAGLEPGAEISCWVNPEDPSRAVLQHFTKAGLYSIWFPGLFVVGGLGIALKALTGGRNGKD